MKYLDRKPPPESLRFEPYTVEQIDAHLDSYKIWATVTAIRQEAQQAIRRAYEDGVRDGLSDRDA